MIASELMDVINESEESDPELMSVLSESAILEDLCYEIDIARYYRRLCSTKDEMANRFSAKSSRKSTKSESTQTEPDTSGISPSWILAGQKLVSELYTGLGNILNTLYHAPNCSNKQGAKQPDVVNIEPSGMKYFRYENGYWQSTLLPNIRIPASNEVDRQNKAQSGDLKKKLNNLLEKATKLRDIIPNGYEDDSLFHAQTVEGGIHCTNKSTSRSELRRSKSPCGDACHSMSREKENSLLTDVSDTSKSDSGKSSDLSPEYARDDRFIPRKAKEYVQVTPHGKKLKFGKRHEPNRIPGVVISKYELPPRASACTKRSVPDTTHARKKGSRREVNADPSLQVYGRSSLWIVGGEMSKSVIRPPSPFPISHRIYNGNCSSNSFRINTTSNTVKCASCVSKRNSANLKQEKHVSQGESCSSDKADRLPNGCKNFIKRNILASKYPPSRASCSKVKHIYESV